MDSHTKADESLFKGVLIAFFVLALHVVLIAGLAVLALFFRGVVNYMLWILLGGLALIGFSVFYFFRRIRAEGKSLRDVVSDPVFSGRSVEVSILGGIASVKLGRPQHAPAIGHDGIIDLPRLEDPETSRNREVSELAELARLLEKELITRDEFNRAKQRLLQQ